MKVVPAIFFLFAARSLSFQAFDCDSEDAPGVFYNALDVESCDDVDSWYTKEESKNIQVVQRKHVQELELTVCHVTESLEVGYCGVDHLSYGFGEIISTEDPVTLTPRECERLVRDNVLTYRNGRHVMKNLKHFSKDIPLFGTVRGERGRCDNAVKFSIDGRTFDHNWIKSVVKGHVFKQTVKYDPKRREIVLEGRTIDVSDGSFRGDLETYVWNPETLSSCSDQYMETYRGPGKLFQPNIEDLSSYILANDEREKLVFGLELKEEERICGSTFHSTHLTGVYVTYTDENHIFSIDANARTNRIDSLISLLTYNFIKRTQSFKRAIIDIAKTVCLNTRDILLNRIQILKSHPDSGVFDLFGEGFGAAVYGSVIKIWQCTAIEVQLNKNLGYSSQDIPVTYIRDGEEKQGFVDNKSKKLKTSSKIYPPNSVINPTFFIDQDWWCGGNGQISICDKPDEFSVNIDGIQTALTELHVETKTSGGFISRESREFKKTVTLARDSNSLLFNMSKSIATQDYDSLREVIGLPKPENTFTKLWNSAFQHPLAIKSVALFSFVCITSLVYLALSARRCFSVKDERSKEKDKKNRLSSTNYVWATVNHTSCDSNMNKHKFDGLRRRKEKLKKEIETLKARLTVSATIPVENYSVIEMEPSCPSYLYPDLNNL